MISIAIIDVIGLTYDGSTLQKRGLGGSESAVILMAKELHNLGFKVTVFNNCIDREASPGIYDGVEYIDLSQIETLEDPKFDVVIGSRTVAPFLPPHIWPNWSYRVDIHERIRRHAKLKVLWLHDTFCAGDELLEDLVVNGHIDEIFTLSDFHTSYVTNCDHGRKRNFEVLKHKVFITRNGITKYHDEVDIASKDPNLFVYNASVTKGMIPLVERIWPQFKARVPDAQLKIIGGYYRFRENLEPDEQEKKWRLLANDPSNPEKGIEFTGIIKQSEIADILAKASYMLYPGAFPETFGISTLESLAYNTPLITSRFGALEETAFSEACYLLDYPIEPNGLFPHINVDSQASKFTEMAVAAYHNKYLHQQKMYMCSAVKDICTWDTVALQWKQHFFRKLGLYLSRDEYRKVTKINSRVKQVFGRRFSNTEDVYIPRSTQQKIVVVTPAYNAEQYITKCIESVVSQDYDNWEMYIIDDCSTDNTFSVASQAAMLSDKITVIRNPMNMGAVYNHVTTIKQFCDPDDIVMLIDGDDALVNDNQIFQFYNNLYDGSTEFSYGSCWSMIDKIPLVAQHYPKRIKETKSYRGHVFNWNMPYTHLRTFQAKFLLQVDEDEFKDENGAWYKAGGDGAVFYSVIEQVDPDKIKVVQDIVYLYNDMSPINDYKVNGAEQTRNANRIRSSNRVKDKFSVVIPTMWRAMDLMPELLESLVAHELVGEVIIINNEVNNTPTLSVLRHPKIVMIDQETNIMVNPAWNLGVEIAKYNKMCFCNDDIVFDVRLFNKIYDRITPEYGPHGIIWGKEEFNQPPTTDGSIDFIEWKPGDVIHCFGQLHFQHKDSWIPIHSDLKMFYGDDWIFHNALSRNLTPWLIYNINFKSRNSATGLCEDIVPLVNERYKLETPIYQNWASQHVANQTNSRLTMKKILIAIPTNKYVETTTMKAVYDLEVPEGYTTDLQFFYGYQVDQIRNLIADWAKHYDYLFSVDSDIAFPSDTLKRLLSHNKDIVSGLYIQRKPGQHILELYRNGTNVPYQDIEGQGLVEIDGCGFGCVLINSNVIRAMEYPHFVYKSAIDHSNTLSEDVYFCLKAKEKGFKLYADTDVRCDHYGTTALKVQSQKPPVIEQPKTNRDIDFLLNLSNTRMIPAEHVNYLFRMRDSGSQPRVIYDIGACVLHWTREAINAWPHAKFIAFDAMEESKAVFDHFGFDSHIGVLSDRDDDYVTFYKNVTSPGGNSYYKESTQYSPAADQMYGDFNAHMLRTFTLDSIVEAKGFPLPDLIKIDVQGAELDVLKGATKTLASCKDIIVELQLVEYNEGAPSYIEVITYLKSQGFELVGSSYFSKNGDTDADFHFTKVK